MEKPWALSLGSLSVSDAPLPASLLPPVSGLAPSERGVFRRELHGALRSIFPSSAAPGAVRTYEAIVPEALGKLESLVTRVLRYATDWMRPNFRGWFQIRDRFRPKMRDLFVYIMCVLALATLGFFLLKVGISL